MADTDWLSLRPPATDEVDAPMSREKQTMVTPAADCTAPRLKAHAVLARFDDPTDWPARGVVRGGGCMGHGVGGVYGSKVWGGLWVMGWEGSGVLVMRPSFKFTKYPKRAYFCPWWGPYPALVYTFDLLLYA